MKIALITCTRNRESHIQEFLKHYKDIDTIFLCDNNNIGTDTLSSFIKDNVVYMDYRGVQDVQHKCYDEVINKYRNSYDYYCIFDDDEFITFKQGNIREFLSQDKFKDTDVVKIPWVNMLLPIEKIFKLNTTNYNYSDELTYVGYMNRTQTKSIIRYRKDLVRVSAHFPIFGGKCVIRDCNGSEMQNIMQIGYDFSFFEPLYSDYLNSIRNSLDAYLMHYKYKSKQEYFDKMIGQRAICVNKQFYTIFNIDQVVHKYFRHYYYKETQLECLFKAQYVQFLKEKGLL